MRNLQALSPREINDFMPLIRVSLAKLKLTFEREKDEVPEGNRIYYFNQRLGVEPAVIAKYFSTHMFMFKLEFKLVEEILNIMLEFEIPPMRILRDLWAFNYLPESIRARLEHCQKTEKGNLKPWMIRCTEGVLERSLTLTKEKQNLLGEGTIANYISQRLNVDVELVELILAKHEAVKKTKVAKVNFFFNPASTNQT